MANNLQLYTLDEWAIHMGLSYEEVYEPDIAYIVTISGSTFKQLESTGELVLLD